MITIPSDLSGLDKRQLQDLAQAATEQLMPSCNGDFIRANRLCRAQNPALFAAIDKDVFSQPDQPPTISQAARQAVVQPEQVIDTLGLNGTPTLGEITACWKGMRQKADPALAPEAFESLASLAMQEKNISYDAAISAVSIRFPVLAQKKDAALAARKIGATLPHATTGGDSRVNPGSKGAGSATLGNDGGTAPALSQAALLNVWQPLLKRAKQESANGSAFAAQLIPALEKLVERIKSTGRDF